MTEENYTIAPAPLTREQSAAVLKLAQEMLKTGKFKASLGTVCNAIIAHPELVEQAVQAHEQSAKALSSMVESIAEQTAREYFSQNQDVVMEAAAKSWARAETQRREAATDSPDKGNKR